MSTTPYTDGTFTTAKQRGPRRPSYPFGNNPIPDVYPVVYDREMVVLPGSYSPAMATRTSPTNLLTYSEQFDHADWVKTATTVSANAVANPCDGAVTADSLLETTANSEHQIVQSPTTAATATTFYAFVKGNGRTWCRLVFIDSAAITKTAFFDIGTGVVGTVDAGATSEIVAVPGATGWYRCAITFTSPAAGVSEVRINPATGASTVSYAGDAAKGLYIWGAQVASGATARAYIVTTSATRSGSAPNLEINETTSGTDVFAFLAGESNPVPYGPGALSFIRTYARIPGAQIIPSTKYFNRPSMDDVVSGNNYGAALIPGYSHVFATGVRKNVTSFVAPDVPINSDPANGSTPGSLGHVQISITMDNSAQTFYADDNDATIWAALSLAVSGNNVTYASENYYPILRNAGKMVIGDTTINSKVKALSSNDPTTVVSLGSGRMLGTGSATTDLLEIVSDVANADSIRTVNATGHGGVAGDRVVFWNGNKIVAKGSVATQATDSFTVRLDEIPGKDFTATHCGFSTDATAAYVDGPKVCTVRRTQNFYLPGVSAGITTYADIPTQAVYTDPTSWLGRILAVPTGWATIEVSDVTQWMGPILMQEVTEIQMADAIDTVTP